MILSGGLVGNFFAALYNPKNVITKVNKKVRVFKKVSVNDILENVNFARNVVKRQD